ncbi:MAG: Hsp20 family protein [Pseudomonadota bacterium]
MRTLDLSPLFRSSVGFDALDKLLDSAFRESAQTSYPPYNIVKSAGDRYRIEIAVAGFVEADLDITQHQNMLVVRGQAQKRDEDKQEYLHRGLAQRAFEHKFQLADHVHVDGARLDHGMLTIELVREVPEAMQPRKVSITNGATNGHGEKPKVIDAA